MIKQKNKSEELIVLRKPGAAAVANAIDGFVMPFNGYIKAIFATFGQMGTDGTGSPTQDVIADVKLVQGGTATTVFSAAGKISWAHAGQVGTATTTTAPTSYAAFTTNPPSVNKGSFVRLDITQILNGTSPTQPTDLTVHIVIAKKLAQSSPAGTLTGQVDENN